MDFIERWFGISPDGGSGAFEILVIASVAAMIGIAWFRRSLVRACSRAIAHLRELMYR